VRESFGGAVANGVSQTGAAGLAIIVFLKQLFAGERSLRELGGPILIGQISGQVARLGIETFLSFLAFFSVQLAVLNILPIPVLDGGHVVFLLAEAVAGKPVPLVWRIRLLNVGFWVLVGIMLVALGNDVLRLIP
jgi:regulator of sigma E protease